MELFSKIKELEDAVLKPDLDKLRFASGRLLLVVLLADDGVWSRLIPSTPGSPITASGRFLLVVLLVEDKAFHYL